MRKMSVDGKFIRPSMLVCMIYNSFVYMFTLLCMPLVWLAPVAETGISHRLNPYEIFGRSYPRLGHEKSGRKLFFLESVTFHVVKR